jgi:uncharacterized protein
MPFMQQISPSAYDGLYDLGWLSEDIMAVTSGSTYMVNERKIMLKLAREAVTAAAALCPPPDIDLLTLPQCLREHRACFVSLYRGDELRGCTGVLVARTALAMEIVHSAAQTALSDPRFAPVQPNEVSLLEISISVLTPSTTLSIAAPSDILRTIRPGIDGITLTKGAHRATFLPQVWERVPEPAEFLSLLCQKMGLPRRAWLITPMIVETYQSEEVSEAEFRTRV